MRAYLANLTTKARILLAVPLIAIAYVIVTIVVPAVVHAAVPEVVRSVLSLI
jgi:Na+/alanine symporter